MATEFKLCVLKTVNKIPRGKVATYSDVAKLAGFKKAHRAIGNALSKNPYPLLIACHRVVRKDRSIGGFQGSEALKKRLLRIEGVTFDKEGKIPDDFFIRQDRKIDIC